MADQERREVEFHDRPTETGVKINNILTGLLLAAALWVGNSVEDLKEAVIRLATQQEHNEEALADLERDINETEGRVRTLERLHPEYYQYGPKQP